MRPRVALSVISTTLAPAFWIGHPDMRAGTASAQQTAPGPAIVIDTFQFKPREIEVREGAKVGFGAPSGAPSTTASSTKAADLRVAVNNLLVEHAGLAASATGAALAGRAAQFNAAAAALDANSDDIVKAIASVYGEDAGRAFSPLWKRHIGFVVDYTTALALKDKMKQEKAVGDLPGYTRDFGAFINSATKTLPTEAVAELVKMHILTLKAVIDAQAAGDHVKTYASLRKAMGHMQMVADPLAEAIVKQFPDQFAR